MNPHNPSAPTTGGPPTRPRVFRDPVHGDITFPRGPFQRLLESLIDTELFQRLRGIRQTAVMNLVFHGAEHSRFVHSMGAAHVAGMMVDAAAANSGLSVSSAEREEIVLAALLHDVGHGPFSHSMEEIIGDGFQHERMSLRILAGPESEIHRLLVAHRPDLPSRLAAFIEHAPSRSWRHDIVSSQLDADRLDYLARDGLMAGIRSHAFDLRRLVRSLVVIDNHLVVDARAQDNVEAFLLALDQMYGTAYYHKTVRAASLLLEAIVRRALRLARESPRRAAALFPPRPGRSPDGDRDPALAIDPFLALLEQGDQVPLEDYVRLDEAHVMSLMAEWRSSDDPALADLVTCFKTRRFPKMVRLPIESRTMSRADWQGAAAVAHRIFTGRFPDRDPEDYVHFDEPGRLSYKLYSAAGTAKPIRLTTPSGGSRPIESDPRSIANNLSLRLYFPRLFVPEAIREEVEHALGGQGHLPPSGPAAPAAT